MSMSLLGKIFDDLHYLEYRNELALQNYNEPLANERIVDEYRLARNRLPRAALTLYTNGDYLTTELFNELISVGVTRMRISRYPVDPRRPVRQPGHRIRKWAARSLGIDVPEPVLQHNGYCAVFDHQTTRVEILLPDVMGSFTDRGGAIPYLSARVTRTQPCHATSTSASIDYHGRLKMCCNIVTDWQPHDEYFIGSLATSSFDELWFSPRMTALRTRHRAADWTLSHICGTCKHRVAGLRQAD
jgi:radical SAM protein with 4Fe4S-binding SPASM domain